MTEIMNDIMESSFRFSHMRTELQGIFAASCLGAKYTMTAGIADERLAACSNTPTRQIANKKRRFIIY